jgi:hypothetical protein
MTPPRGELSAMVPMDDPIADGRDAVAEVRARRVSSTSVQRTTRTVIALIIALGGTIGAAELELLGLTPTDAVRVAGAMALITSLVTLTRNVLEDQGVIHDRRK